MANESIKEVIKPKLRKNRCYICNKKYGPIPFECKCGGKFCTKHRYTDSHDCKFDHKSVELEILKQNNPIVISDKITDRI